MIETIFVQKIKKARKEYTCDACLWLLNTDSLRGLIQSYNLTFSEIRAFVNAKNNDYKILKGQPYIRQFNKDGSDTWTYTAIPEIHDICIKYDLYEY